MNGSVQSSKTIDELAEKISPLFSVYDIQMQEGSIFFIGLPRRDIRTIYQELWAVFAQKGYQFSARYELGEHMLVASPVQPARERRWVNVALLIATCITTMIAGSMLYGADLERYPYAVVQGIPFTIAIMTVLGAHEAGHYIVSKKHSMQTSLPYFIPFPTIIGTMGAVIRHKGAIPNRKVLFDVGISGPLIGLFASVIVTLIGLLQPPLPQPPAGDTITLGIPPLFGLIMSFLPAPESFVMHPIAFAGWAGMLVTALNLIPAGQLDGGHVLRAMIGEKASRISAILPIILSLAGIFMIFVLNIDGSIWIVWSILLLIFSSAGHPRPLNDDIPLDRGRIALGLITFVLGLLCITPVPFQFPSMQ